MASSTDPLKQIPCRAHSRSADAEATVVAEGIETHEQLLHLKQLGATIGQGYLLARPMSPTQIVELLSGPVSIQAEACTRS